MSLSQLVAMNNSVQSSPEFEPAGDFFLCVDKGDVALSAKLPGASNFYLIGTLSETQINAKRQVQGTMVKVTPYVAGTKYKIVPQSRRATAVVYG